MVEHTAVNVAVDEEHREACDEVAGELRAAGMNVTETLHNLGIVVGWVAPGGVERLRDVRGVLAVEASREVRTA